MPPSKNTSKKKATGKKPAPSNSTTKKSKSPAKKKSVVPKVAEAKPKKAKVVKKDNVVKSEHDDDSSSIEVVEVAQVLESIVIKVIQENGEATNALNIQLEATSSTTSTTTTPAKSQKKKKKSDEKSPSKKSKESKKKNKKNDTSPSKKRDARTAEKKQPATSPSKRGAKKPTNTSPPKSPIGRNRRGLRAEKKHPKKDVDTKYKFVPYKPVRPPVYRPTLSPVKKQSGCMEINSTNIPRTNLELYIYENLRLLQSTNHFKGSFLESQFSQTIDEFSLDNRIEDDISDFFLDKLLQIISEKSVARIIVENALRKSKYQIVIPPECDTKDALETIRESPLEWRYDSTGRAITARRNVFDVPFARMTDSRRSYTTKYSDREIFNQVRKSIRSGILQKEKDRIERLNNPERRGSEWEAENAEEFLQERRRSVKTRKVLSLREKVRMLDDAKELREKGSRNSSSSSNNKEEDDDDETTTATTTMMIIDTVEEEQENAEDNAVMSNNNNNEEEKSMTSTITTPPVTVVEEQEPVKSVVKKKKKKIVIESSSEDDDDEMILPKKIPLKKIAPSISTTTTNNNDTPEVPAIPSEEIPLKNENMMQEQPPLSKTEINDHPTTTDTKTLPEKKFHFMKSFKNMMTKSFRKSTN